MTYNEICSMIKKDVTTIQNIPNEDLFPAIYCEWLYYMYVESDYKNIPINKFSEEFLLENWWIFYIYVCTRCDDFSDDFLKKFIIKVYYTYVCYDNKLLNYSFIIPNFYNPISYFRDFPHFTMDWNLNHDIGHCYSEWYTVSHCKKFGYDNICYANKKFLKILSDDFKELQIIPQILELYKKDKISIGQETCIFNNVDIIYLRNEDNIVPIYEKMADEIERGNSKIIKLVLNYPEILIDFTRKYTITNNEFWENVKENIGLLKFVRNSCNIPEEYIDKDIIIKFVSKYNQFPIKKYLSKFKDDIEFWVRFIPDVQCYDYIISNKLITKTFQQKVYLYGIENNIFSFDYVSANVTRNNVRIAALRKNSSNLESVVNNIYDDYYAKIKGKAEKYINSLRSGYREVLSVVDSSYFTDEMLKKLKEIKVFE